MWHEHGQSQESLRLGLGAEISQITRRWGEVVADEGKHWPEARTCRASHVRPRSVNLISQSTREPLKASEQESGMPTDGAEGCLGGMEAGKEPVVSSCRAIPPERRYQVPSGESMNVLEIAARVFHEASAAIIPRCQLAIGQEGRALGTAPFRCPSPT